MNTAMALKIGQGKIQSTWQFFSPFIRNSTLIQKGKRNPGLCNRCRSTKGSMHQKTFSLPQREISRHTEIFLALHLLSMGRGGWVRAGY